MPLSALGASSDARRPSCDTRNQAAVRSADEARAAVLAAGARRFSGGGCRRTRCSTPTTRSCGGGAACSACASRTARAGSRSRARCSHRLMKLREEIETVVGDGDMLRVFAGARPPRLVPLREIPRGVRPRRRHRRDRRDAGRRLRRDRGQRAGHRRDGRSARRAPADYILDSYRALFLQYREQRGLDATDMVFDASDGA